MGTGWPLGCRVCCVLSLSQILCLLIHSRIKRWGWRHKTGLIPPVKYFTDRSKAVLLLWILRLLCLCAHLFTRALWSPVGKGLTSWLSFVVSNCAFVTFPLVSVVRCGTRLYRFLIFAPLLTFVTRILKMVYTWSLMAVYAFVNSRHAAYESRVISFPQKYCNTCNSSWKSARKDNAPVSSIIKVQNDVPIVLWTLKL